MEDFRKLLSETKAQLKGMLDNNPSQEQINAIAELDKKLDSLNEVFEGKDKEINSLKDNLIEQVKNTGFKVNGSEHDDSGVDQNQKSMDEIMAEELDKITAKQTK